LDTECELRFDKGCQPLEACTFRSPCLSSRISSGDGTTYTFSTQSEKFSVSDVNEFNLEPSGGLACSRSMSSPFDFSFTNPFASLWETSSSWSICDNIELSSRELRCDWPQCSSMGVFSSVEDYKIHIKDHAQAVSSEWEEGQKCNWYKCSSKASHKSRNLFETHLNNIHVNPLVCTVKNCKHKTPFRANHDLQRHIATAHHVRPKYKCPYKCCAEFPAFIRKDKWLRHLQGLHESDPCPYAHCQRQMESLSPRHGSRHIGKAHSNFECALKSCEGTTSRFSESQFLEHMEVHHAMEWALVLKMRDIVKRLGGRTLRSKYLPQDVEVHDCKICTNCAFNKPMER
jgi:hypothetical protein